MPRNIFVVHEEKQQAEIARLRTALEPFAVAGSCISGAVASGAIPADASIYRLKTDLIASDLVAAALAFTGEQDANK